MKTKTPEISRAVAKLANLTRWHGAGSPQAEAARRELAEVKLARARAEADRLQEELDQLGAAS